MFLFVKSRNNSEPMELVPWKSLNNDQKKNDLQVPQRATTITTIFLLVYLCSLPIIVKRSEIWIDLTYTIAIVGTPPLPLMLIFTIKQKIKSSVALQPPRNLQFHESILTGMIHMMLNLNKGLSFLTTEPN